MLIALPLKALAAVGVQLCCPPGAPAAVAVSHPAGHETHTAAAQADHGGGEHADDHGHAGAKLKPLCCGGAAMTAEAPRLALAAPERTEPLAHAGSRYLSAWLPGADKPPRS